MMSEEQEMATGQGNYTRMTARIQSCVPLWPSVWGELGHPALTSPPTNPPVRAKRSGNGIARPSLGIAVHVDIRRRPGVRDGQ